MGCRVSTETGLQTPASRVIIAQALRGEAYKPLCIAIANTRAAVQSNKVYLPQEVLLVSNSLASRQINAIR